VNCCTGAGVKVCGAGCTGALNVCTGGVWGAQTAALAMGLMTLAVAPPFSLATRLMTFVAVSGDTSIVILIVFIMLFLRNIDFI
jgi:hypothetical protein